MEENQQTIQEEAQDQPWQTTLQTVQQVLYLARSPRTIHKEDIKMPIDFTNIMKHKTAYFDMEEVDAMLEFCDTENRIRDYMLLLTLLRTGRRITEVVGEKPYTIKVGLRPCDLHPDGMIEFDILKKDHIKTKTKSGQNKSEEVLQRARLNKMPQRKLKPVDDEYFEMLQAYIDNQGISTHERVFPITRQRADMIIKEIARKCRISRPKMKIHCHMFRHTLPIWLLKNNPNDASVLRHIQELLDHSDIKVTMTYAQFTQYDKKDKLNQLFQED